MYSHVTTHTPGYGSEKADYVYNRLIVSLGPFVTWNFLGSISFIVLAFRLNGYRPLFITPIPCYYTYYYTLQQRSRERLRAVNIRLLSHQ